MTNGINLSRLPFRLQKLELRLQMAAVIQLKELKERVTMSTNVMLIL